MGHLRAALSQAYDELRFGQVSGGEEMLRQLVLARIIEPASKPGSLRVLAGAGVAASSYRTLRRPPAGVRAGSWRQQFAAARARRSPSDCSLARPGSR